MSELLDEIDRCKRLIKNHERLVEIVAFYALPVGVSMLFLGLFLIMAASAYRIAVDPVKTQPVKQSVVDE